MNPQNPPSTLDPASLSSGASENELRALVRQSVARALGQPAGGVDGHLSFPVTSAAHSSHFRYTLPESDGPCLIEPSVQCNHCGYCQSHGH